jgi:hypothetical protein
MSQNLAMKLWDKKDVILENEPERLLKIKDRREKRTENEPKTNPKRTGAGAVSQG